MRFRILPKVHGFTDARGVTHLPGEIVELPPSYEGESWLERVDKPVKVEVPPPRVEPVAEVKPDVPFGESKKLKKTK